ncbi:MAG: ribose 5-phosphate isomerase B [Clostridia bacterium]|nr:ribose 5-phosphate isomerase B [Clostridia bacterium]
MLYIACDHGGFDLKTKVVAHLKKLGIKFDDLGAYTEDNEDDFPVYAKKLVAKVAEDENNRGILICGSGVGMSICANRNPHIRAALCKDINTAKLCRLHNDANVLVLAGRSTGVVTANKMVISFLNTEHLGGKYARRMKMIDE